MDCGFLVTNNCRDGQKAAVTRASRAEAPRHCPDVEAMCGADTADQGAHVVLDADVGLAGEGAQRGAKDGLAGDDVSTAPAWKLPTVTTTGSKMSYRRVTMA